MVRASTASAAALRIPTIFYRISGGAKRPKHQFYIPGFNPGNSCWLEGDWVSVAAEEWVAKKDAFQAMFAGTADRATSQRHDGPPTKIEDLTEAQRVAYNHFSGQLQCYARMHGGVYPVAIDLAGNGSKPATLAWLREQGIQVIRYTRNAYTGEVTDALDGRTFPDDVLSADTEPLDPWSSIVSQNLDAMHEQFEGMLEHMAPNPAENDMGAAIVLHYIIEKEDGIIRAEWDQQRGVHDPYANIERHLREYREARAKCSAKFGATFAARYEAARAQHNKNARDSLGNTGISASFVLPTFNADGTHEPWGPRDVPWGAVEQVASRGAKLRRSEDDVDD